MKRVEKNFFEPSVKDGVGREFCDLFLVRLFCIFNSNVLLYRNWLKNLGVRRVV